MHGALFLVRVQRYDNQMFEIKVTSFTVIHKTHFKIVCFLSPSTLGLGVLEVQVPNMGRNASSRCLVVVLMN